MDIMKQYAAHQTALMRAQAAGSCADRRSQFAAASKIAGQISAFQRELGAAAACAWSMAEISAAARA
jgi:DNA-binding FrmR family transcriptional regulator